jgi:proline racemase
MPPVFESSAEDAGYIKANADEPARHMGTVQMAAQPARPAPTNGRMMTPAHLRNSGRVAARNPCGRIRTSAAAAGAAQWVARLRDGDSDEEATSSAMPALPHQAPENREGS